MNLAGIIVLSTLGVSITIAVGVFLLLRSLKSKPSEGTLELDLVRLQENFNSKEERLLAAESENKELKNQISDFQIQLAKAESQRETLQESLKAERQLLDVAQEKLKDTFKSLASTALEGNTKQFLELAKSHLSKESEVAQKELEKKEQSIESLVKPLSQVLEKYQGQISEIEKQRQKSYSSIESELKKVIDTTHSLSHETFALKNALKKPHVRGRWGEVQLKNCIELAGMSEYADVNFQASSVDPEGQLLIPDMTVRMPGGRIIVVDSKTPIDAFLSSLEQSSEEARSAEMIRHGKHVREHIKKLSLRAYSDSLKDSPDFTVMFLPNESFLYAALETQPDLMEYALEKKILVTTPPTLIGLLKVIRFGWNEEKLAENAIRISDAGKELHKRLVEFVDGYLVVGKSLEKAKTEFDKGLNRLERRLISKAREMETLGVKSNKSLPECAPTSPSLDSGDSPAVDVETV